MKEIPLTQGKVALVDDEDYELASHHNWTASFCGQSRNKVYARRTVKLEHKQRVLYLHRVLMMAQNGEEIDHINGDTLNNQKSNLRRCTRLENNRNAKPRAGGASIYKGVSFDGRRNKWRAHIKLNGDSTALGSFNNETEAAHAYDRAAREYFGEFARLNFPDEGRKEAI